MKKLFLIIAVLLMSGNAGCAAVSQSHDAAILEEPELTEEEKAQIRREEQLVPLLLEAEQLAMGYYYDEALDLLNNAPLEFADDPEITAAAAKYHDAANAFVSFEEPVRHIFFHSLIVDTDLAFDGDHMSNGYNYWMTTVAEFKSMLVELYQNDFILIDIHDIEQPMVPEGKKPLILSVDDVNYYEYMEKDGFARNLMLNENRDVKNLYIDEAGNQLIGDYDVVPILDAFVKEHPDFSLRGAKGILALTGYEGVLGYRTNEQESPTCEQDKAAARAVADRLKETGWQFAVHGWGHRDAKKISYDSLVRDTSRWKEEVGSLVGDTDIYIYPYGSEVEYPGDKLDFLISEGYRYFCGVWTKPYVEITDTYIRNSRCNLDGFNMITRPNSLADLFDTEKVLDQTRPELE